MVATLPLHDPALWAGDPCPAWATLRAADPVYELAGPLERWPNRPVRVVRRRPVPLAA